MAKGRLLLIAASALEGRIVISFLEAADYEVVDFSAFNLSRTPRHFDTAILILDEPHTQLEEECAHLRETVGQDALPIIAVLPEPPAQNIDGLSVLLRPIRLFELTEAVQSAIAGGEANIHHLRA